MTHSSSVWYKGVRVGKGCALAAALERKDEKEAKKIHTEAMSDFKRRYPQCTNEWFARMNGSRAAEALHSFSGVDSPEYQGRL